MHRKTMPDSVMLEAIEEVRSILIERIESKGKAASKAA